MRGEERNKRRKKKKKGSIISGVDAQRRGHTLVFRRKENTGGKIPISHVLFIQRLLPLALTFLFDLASIPLRPRHSFSSSWRESEKFPPSDFKRRRRKEEGATNEGYEGGGGGIRQGMRAKSSHQFPFFSADLELRRLERKLLQKKGFSAYVST